MNRLGLEKLMATLTGHIADFIILAKAGVAMPQTMAEIRAMAS